MIRRLMQRHRSLTIDVVDWSLKEDGGRLVFKPSEETFYRTLWVTLFAAVFIGLIMWTFGLPPGSYKVSEQRRKVAELEQRVSSLEKQSSRARTGMSEMSERISEQSAQAAARARQDLAREKARLAQTRATLGPAGDAAYWSAVGLLALVGVGVPVSCKWHRVELALVGGELRITRGLPPRTARFAAEGFAALGASVHRLVLHNRQTHRTRDHGWLWTIILASDPSEPGAVQVRIRAELNPMLPTNMASLTSRVRPIVRWLEQATSLRCQPPIQTDIADISAWPWGTRYKMRSRQHASVETSKPYREL